MTPATLKAVRLTHLYSGVFLAPAILFFATTGGLQMFGLHETSRGSAYKPPAILVSLGQIHKKGTYVLPQRRPGPPAAPSAAAAPTAAAAPAAAAAQGATPSPTPRQQGERPEGPKKPNPLPFKVFAAIVSIGLILSTITGLIMSWKYARRKSVVAALFAAGIVIPILLLAI